MDGFSTMMINRIVNLANNADDVTGWMPTDEHLNITSKIDPEYETLAVLLAWSSRRKCCLRFFVPKGK
jgi:hypothetical protein